MEEKEQELELLISSILNGMNEVLNKEQLDHLKNNLYININNFKIQPKSSTSLIIYKKTYLDILNIFLNAKSLEGKSTKTIERYKDMLTKMLLYINKDIKDITVWDLRAYLSMYKETRHVCDNTLDGMRRIITSFFNWLTTEKYLQDNPSSRLKKIKVEKKVKTIISAEEMEILRMSCKNDRDIALIDLLYVSGMRVGEIYLLNINDINFNNKSIIVLGKGNKQRKVYFNGETKVRLMKYLAGRKDHNPALFVSLKRGPHMEEPKRLSIKGIEARIKIIAKDAGLTNIHPHKFRRTMATNMASKNISVDKIASLLGHEKISTTQEYLVNNTESIENSYRMCF